jgi:hypothetical protein
LTGANGKDKVLASKDRASASLIIKRPTIPMEVARAKSIFEVPRK